MGMNRAGGDPAGRAAARRADDHDRRADLVDQHHRDRDDRLARRASRTWATCYRGATFTATRACWPARSWSRCSPLAVELHPRWRCSTLLTPRGLKLQRAAAARIGSRRARRRTRLETGEGVPDDISRPRRCSRIALVASLALGVSACGCEQQRPAARAQPHRAQRRDNLIQSNPANGKVSLTVGSKNFTEEYILGEIYAQALEAAGLQRPEAAQPRLRDDRPQGDPERRHQRLPGVHVDGPRLVLPGAAAEDALRCQPGGTVRRRRILGRRA